MMFKGMPGIFVVVIGVIGCASTSSVRLGDASHSRPAVPWQQVVVYSDAAHVPGRYEEVALLHTTGHWGWGNEGTMYNSMKKDAGKLGANAIILDSMSEPSAGAKVASAIFGVGGAERKGKAMAIFVFPPGDSSATGKGHQ